MIAYLESSAAGKLLAREPESDALAEFLSGTGEPLGLVSSILLDTELRRIATRHSIPQTSVSAVLRRVGLVVPTRAFFHEAGLLPGAWLRSLDALHLITAIKTGSDVVISYDRRLIEAAESVGLTTLSPA